MVFPNSNPGRGTMHILGTGGSAIGKGIDFHDFGIDKEWYRFSQFSQLA